MIKADGLAAGKGVTVCDDGARADEALAAVFADGDDPGGAPRVVVEERLRGPEASVIALCDGTTALALPAARDHKRLGDGDTGPNTGGMGAYSPLPDVDDALAAEVLGRFHRPALAELARRGLPFRGALYAGLILTPDRGAVLLEFNARLGDPETQAILPRVAVPLAPLLLAAARGALHAGGWRAALPAVTCSRPRPRRPWRSSSRRGTTPRPPRPVTPSGGSTRRRNRRPRLPCRHASRGGWGLGDRRWTRSRSRRPRRDVTARAHAAERAADLISFNGLQRRRDIARRGDPAGVARGAAR